MNVKLQLALLFLSGAALAGSHLLIGLLLTPFFGDGPFLGAIVLISLVSSLTGGLLLGALPRRFARLEARHFAIAGGVATSLAPLALPWISRAFLDPNPDAWLPAPLACLALLTLPGALLSAPLPALSAARSRKKGSRSALPLEALAALSGAVAGTIAALPALLSADIPASHLCLALGVVTAALASLEGGRRARLATLAILCPLTGLCLLYEGELTSLEYRTALRRSFKHRVGRYYMSTAGRRVLENSELKLTYERLLTEVEGKEDRTAAAIVTLVRILESMGRVETTGKGLGDTLREVMSDTARRYVLPLLEAFETVHSDGQGRISIVVAPSSRGRVIRIPWNQKGDELSYKILLADDFSFAITRKQERTEVKIEPEVIRKGGFFALNESHETPVQIQDVKLFVDACLLSIIVENQADKVIVHVRAQGSMGGVVQEVVQVIEK